MKERTRGTSGSLGTEAPATFSPSGSGAPSNLRVLRAAAGPLTVGRLAASLRLRELRVTSRRPVPRGPPPDPPCGVPCGAAGSGLAAFSGVGVPLGSSRSSWNPRVRFILRCPGRSSGPLASSTSTAWSEAKDTGGTEGGQLRISAGQSMNMQVDAVGQRVTNR